MNLNNNQGKGQSKPRVLISGHLPPPIGGMATYYLSLVNSRLQEKVDYQFVQTSSQKRQGGESGLVTISNIIAAIKDCLRFTRAILRFQPQIAHIGTAFGLSFLKHSYCVFITRMLRIRVLLHPHCSLSFLYPDRSRLWQWFFRRVIHSTDGVVALSREWLQLSSIIPKVKVYILPNAIDVKFYEQALEKHLKETKNGNPLKILYLGYLGIEKGSFDILDSAATINSLGLEMDFDLVGSESTPGELAKLQEKRRSAKLEKSVKLNPPAFGKEKLEFFQNADIFIYPSYHEGMPMAVLEAMASGLPIIATNVGGLPDLVQDGINGLLVDPGQPDQLADALCNLANNLELLQSMQKMSYQFVSQNFDIDNHINQLVRIYEDVINV